MTLKHANTCCLEKPKSSKDLKGLLPMKCGIRLGPLEISIAVITDDGDFVYSSSFKPADTYSELLVQLAAALKHCSNRYDIPSPVGVSVKGHETPSTGMITSLHHPLIAQKTLRRDMQAALKHSVIVASDGQCLAVAARSVLELDNKPTIFALSLDQSVCGGIIVSDKLLFGPHGLAGDWGHLSLPWPVDHEMEGRICVCGRTGCLEHFVSLEGLSHDYELLTGKKLTSESIIKQAETGDIVAESAMQVLEDRISRGLAMVIGLLDPDVILIGGMLAESKRLFTNIPRKWPGNIRSSVNSDILVPLRTSNPCPDHLYLHGAGHLCDYAK